MLFFLQSLATLLFGTDFRSIGLRLPIIELGDIFISYSRLLAFGTALVGAVALYLFLSRTYLGIAMRAIAQDREIMGLMGVDQRRIYLITSAVERGARGARSLPSRPAIRRAPIHRAEASGQSPS